MCVHACVRVYQIVTDGVSRVWSLYQALQRKGPWPAPYWGVFGSIVCQCEWVNVPLGFMRASSWTYCPKSNDPHQWRPPCSPPTRAGPHPALCSRTVDEQSPDLPLAPALMLHSLISRYHCFDTSPRSQPSHFPLSPHSTLFLSTVFACASPGIL